MYADRRGQRTAEKLVGEKVQNHTKKFTRKLKEDKKVKHERREPGRGVSFSRSNIERALRIRVPQIPNCSAVRRPNITLTEQSPGDLPIPTTNTAPHLL